MESVKLLSLVICVGFGAVAAYVGESYAAFFCGGFGGVMFGVLLDGGSDMF
jgi:hypothetical protein